MIGNISRFSPALQHQFDGTEIAAEESFHFSSLLRIKGLKEEHNILICLLSTEM